jgi:hypothetical protein
VAVWAGVVSLSIASIIENVHDDLSHRQSNINVLLFSAGAVKACYGDVFNSKLNNLASSSLHFGLLPNFSPLDAVELISLDLDNPFWTL